MNKYIIIVSVAAFLFVGAILVWGGNNNVKKDVNLSDPLYNFNTSPTQSPSPTVSNAQITHLIIEDVKEGTGSAVKEGDTVNVHYVGTLTNGQKFDSSIDRNSPFSFNVGAGDVIAGWDQGLLGMKQGGKRRLIIPADLAYGAQAVGPIPPNSPLIFEIELLKIN